MHDGSITFSTALDNAKLEKDLSGLTKKIEKKEQEIADLRTKRDAGREKSLFDAAALDAEKAKLQEIEDRLADIRARVKDKGISTQEREDAKALLPSVQEELAEQKIRVGAIQTEWNKLENSIDRYTKSLAEAEAALKRQKEEAGYLQQQISGAEQARADVLASAEVADQHIVDLNRKLLELKERQKELEDAGIGLGYQEYDTNAARIAEITQELTDYQKELSQAGDNQTRAATAAERMRSALSKVVELFGSMGRLAKTALKSAEKALASTAKKAASFLGHMNVFSRLTSSLGGKLKRLGQMIRRVFVFSAITAGLRAVRSQMAAYLTINSEFSHALRQLRGVLLTAFQPIYDAAVPALTVLLNVLSRVIAAVSQFTAVLFGTTAKKAQGNAKKLYEQADALKATGSAADEAAGSLAGFDEINTISTETGGSGGGRAEVDAGPLFDYEYDDTVFASWGEAFSAFLDKMLAGIPRLEEAFGGFVAWLNGLTANLLEMFTFPGVLEKVQSLGASLAIAFNDLAGQIDWGQLGQSLGAGLNLALQFLANLLYGFDWAALGAALAVALNGLVGRVDWRAFGLLLWSGFRIGLELLAGFLLGLDMPELARAAGDLVMGFFDAMLETIRGVPWAQIGLQIAAFLNGIDWIGAFSSIAKAIAAGINAAITTLAVLAADLNWAEIGTAIGLALNKLFAGIDWAAAGRAFSDGLAGMMVLAISTLEAVDWYALGKDIVSFLENIDWLALLLNLAALLGEAVWAVLQLVGGLIEAHLPEILLAIGAIIAAIALGIPALIAGLGPVIIGAIVALAAVVVAKWDEIVEYFLKEIEECGGNVVLGLLKGIWDAIAGIGAWLKEHLVDPIINGIKELFGIHSPSTVMAEIGVMLIRGLFQGVSETWGSIVEFFAEKLDGLKQTLSDAWNSIKETAAEVWGGIRSFLEEKWSDIKTSAAESWDHLKTTIGDGWENIRAGTSEKWEVIKTALGEAWSTIVEAASLSFGALWSTVSSVWDTLTTSTAETWSGIFTTIQEILMGVVEFVAGVFTGDWGLAWDGVFGIFKAVWNNIVGTLESAVNLIIKGLNWMISQMNKIHFSVPDWVPVIGGKSFSFNIPSLSEVQIPRLAQGAVIPPNREFMAVLGDQRSGNNLEAPEALIRKIVREESGGGNTALLEAILEAIRAGQVIVMDGKAVTKGVVKNMNTMTRQSGRSVVLG